MMSKSDLLKKRKPAVFLDRDGTIIEDPGYLSRPEDICFIPGAASGLRRLQREGYLLILVSNQAGVARGYFDYAQMELIHREFAGRLKKAGVELDGAYYCPHHPLAGKPPWRRNCYCRKPRGGMIRWALRDFPIDLDRSFVIGDKLSDLNLGRRFNLPGILVLTGEGHKTLAGFARRPAWLRVARNLETAARLITKQAP